MTAGSGRRPSAAPAEGQRTAERRGWIRASPRHVWTTLHDPAALAAMLKELRLGPPDPSWPAAGSTRAGQAQLGLLRTEVRIESLEARPDAAFRFAVAATGFVLEWGWRMEPLAGGTRIVHVGAFESHDRWTGLLVRLGRHSLGGLAEAHLRTLKERAEMAAAETATSGPFGGAPA